MSTKATTNRITLKIGVVYDQAEALRQAKQLQNGISSQSDKILKDAITNSKVAAGNIKKTNSALKTQRSFLDKVVGGWDNVVAKTLKATLFTGTFFKLLRQASVAFDLIKELDTAYTNLSIVSKATAQDIAQIDEQVNGLTASLGRMKKEVIDSITEFSRAGFEISESMLLAENAIMGANVGDTTLDKVTTFIIAGLKSFKMEAEDSIRVLDVLFKVANATAINLDGIGEAFLRSANTLVTAGASLEQSAALIAAANETIQNPASVGTALKTIASRLRGVGDEGEVIPTLAKDFKAVGIEIQNADGSFRNIYDVFKDFASIYDTLDDLTKESLLEKLAGKRQKNIMIGLLENFDIAEMAFEKAITSAGEVALAQEKYVESLEGRVNLLKESYNQFLESLTNTEALKEVVSLFVNLIKGLTWVIANAPIIISAIGGIAIAFGFMNPLATAVVAIGVAFFAAQQAIVTFGNETEKTNKKIQSSLTEIEKLQNRIKNIEAIENQTDAEKELLKVYESQLEAQKQILAIQQKKLADSVGGDILKTANEFELIKEKVVTLDEVLKESKATWDEVGEEFDKYQTNILNTELDLLKYIQTTEETIATLEEGSAAHTAWSNNLTTAKGTLAQLQVFAEKYNFSLGSIAKNTEMASDGVNKMRSATERALIDAKEGAKGYQLLSDAIVEVTKNGYLSNDMLDDLVAAYPDIIQLTGLASGEMIKYAESTRQSTEAMIEDHIRLLKTQKTVFQEQIRLYESAMRIAMDNDIGLGESMYMAQFAVSAQTVSLANKAIKDADNAIAMLNNQRKAYEGIQRARDESISSKGGKDENDEKEIRILTETEDRIRRINQAISMQQKLLARTDSEKGQIKINTNMIQLYEELKVALRNQQVALDEKNKSLKRGMDGYEDYVDTTMKLSLEIEDVTNNIFGLKKANQDLLNTMEENRVKSIQEDIKDLNKDFADEIKDQIELQKSLVKERAKYYENEIQNKKNELDALQEQNEAIDDQVRLQELLLDLQNLRERRQNILDNKNVRVVKNSETGFEWIADPRELKQVNEDMVNAEQAIDKFRRDLLIKENERRIELEIEGLEKRAQAEEDSFSKRIESLEIFQNSVNLAIEENLPIPVNLTQTLQDSLTGVEQGSYGVRLSNLSSFISSYNSMIASMASTPSTPNSQSTPITQPASVTSSTSTLTNAASGNKNTSSGSISTVTPKANSIASKITQQATSGSKPAISVNNVNVTSTARTVDAIVTDAINKVKVMAY